MAEFNHKENLKNFKPLYWQGQPIYRQFAKLRNYLRQHLGENYSRIFSEPQLSDEISYAETGSWTSDIITNQAQMLNNDLEKRIHQIVYHKISVITDFAKKQLLSANDESSRWGSLILECLKVPSEDYIFWQDDNFVLVAWGFSLRLDPASGYFLSRHFYRPDQKALSDAVAANEPGKTTEPPFNTAGMQAIETSQVIEDKVSTNNSQAPTLVSDTPTVPEQVSATPYIVTKNKEAKDKGRKKKIWLWLILLVLLVGLFLMFRQCSSTKPILPAKPGVIVPVDTSKIINDPTGYKQIASDRLNVLLIGSDKNSITAFAKKFKQLYPGKEYSIIFYDTISHGPNRENKLFRLQLQVPDTKREELKKELKNKMPEFKMMIMDEGIRQYNRQPNDPGFKDINKDWYQVKVKALEAWDVTEGDSSLVVAIIDDGFDLTHPEFKGKVFRPWNVPSGNSNVYAGSKFIHGTHVAGIALALADNNSGVAGIAPRCRFMPVQVADRYGTMASSYIIDGLLYAIDNGASVINMSLGMQFPKQVTRLSQQDQQSIINTMFKDEEEFWNELFDMAYEKNVVVVMAGGNQDVLIGMDPMDRSDKTIKVSAIDPNNLKASFSNYGGNSTLSAPGVHIYSSLPGANYDYQDGTSMASPVVTGGVALIKSINPSLSFNQVVDLLQSTGIPINEPGKTMGNLIQLDKALGIASNQRNNMPVLDCPDIQSQIDSLLQEIEKLRQQCNNGTPTNDTLKIPPGSNDPSFASGKWKSTTYIYSSTDGKKVTLYFEFSPDGTGKLTLVESDGTTCEAPLDLDISNGEVKITQLKAAVCQPPPKQYQAYIFKCKADINGCAECEAQNIKFSKNKFNFKLVKII